MTRISIDSSAYARVIADLKPTAQIIMADVGKQDGPTIGGHHKNSVKYVQRDPLFHWQYKLIIVY